MLSLEYGLLAAAATMLGGLIVIVAGRWSLANRDYLLAFAAGVLIGLSLLEILPEAFEKSPNAPLFVVAGFFFMYLVEQLAIPHHGHMHDVAKEHAHPHKHDPHEAQDPHEVHETGLGWLAWIGVLIHSFVDGVAISTGAALDPALARSVTAGVMLHELPEGLLAASLLMATGMRPRNIFLLTAAVGLATPVGALVSDLALTAISHESLTRFSVVGMAMAGGTFIYVGVADMLHHAHAQAEGRFRAILAFTAGLSLFVVGRLV